MHPEPQRPTGHAPRVQPGEYAEAVAGSSVSDGVASSPQPMGIESGAAAQRPAPPDDKEKGRAREAMKAWTIDDAERAAYEGEMHGTRQVEVEGKTYTLSYHWESRSAWGGYALSVFNSDGEKMAGSFVELMGLEFEEAKRPPESLTDATNSPITTRLVEIAQTAGAVEGVAEIQSGTSSADALQGRPAKHVALGSLFIKHPVLEESILQQPQLTDRQRQLLGGAVSAWEENENWEYDPGEWTGRTALALNGEQYEVEYQHDEHGKVCYLAVKPNNGQQPTVEMGARFELKRDQRPPITHVAYDNISKMWFVRGRDRRYENWRDAVAAANRVHEEKNSDRFGSGWIPPYSYSGIVHLDRGPGVYFRAMIFDSNTKKPLTKSASYTKGDDASKKEAWQSVVTWLGEKRRRELIPVQAAARAVEPGQ